jgi:hypothetical protein
MPENSPTPEDFEVIADTLMPPAPPAPAFQHVFLERSVPRNLRQTFLRHYNSCPRSAYLMLKYEGLDQTPAMVRGSAAHEVFRRATLEAMEQNEPMIPPDVVKILVDEVLAELPVPFEEHDYVREACFRWASEVAFDPSMVVACETLFELEVGDWRVRARVDFAELLEDDKALLIRDYKTSRAAPPYDEVARKSPDGRLVAKNFQLILYALLLHFGVPVREEPCPNCSDGSVTQDVCCRRFLETGECCNFPVRGVEACETCDGRGVIETPDPFPIADTARRFDLEFVYPGIEDREGKMVRRPLTMDHLELTEYRASLEGLVARVAKSEQTGDWPAVVSDAACSECPASVDCPIPYEVRDHRGVVNTPEQASEAAMVLDRLKATTRSMQTELRNFAKAHGGSFRVGPNKVMELVYTESESLDRDALRLALESGEPVDWQQFVTPKGRTDFKSRDLTAEEQEAGDV